jgi:hypothetical protein
MPILVAALVLGGCASMPAPPARVASVAAVQPMSDELACMADCLDDDSETCTSCASDCLERGQGARVAAGE